MTTRPHLIRCLAIIGAATFCLGTTSSLPGDEGKAEATTSATVDGLSQARERAKMMHEVYASTLDVMHHHFFKPNNPVLPARALEDIFADMARKTKVEARWIAINTKAMSIDHEPKSEFDRKAVAALSAGETSYEQIADGHLQRVGAIPLGGGCVSCHAGLFARPTKAPRVAGLVITVPLPKK
ncbi:MAG: hypothetical protein U0744_05270 [Gemmataceae bacterium]